MYTREIQPPRAAPVENGKPVTGTWDSAFKRVNLLDIKRPFRWPLSRFFCDFRLKEWESFNIQDDQFYLEALFANLKYYSVIEVVFFNKETKDRRRFIRILPLSAWHSPSSLASGSVEYRSNDVFFRVHNWLAADTIRVDLDIAARPRRPAFTAHATYDLKRKKTTPLTVNLPLSGDRCLYSCKAISEVRGDLVFDGRHIALNPARTTGFFRDCKGFFPYRMHYVSCLGFGIGAENHRYGFSVVENNSREPGKNNANALWLDGRMIPLPPVRITMPEGPGSDWIIQDLEGMVDLTFTPKEFLHSAFNVLLTRSEYYTPLGIYNGMLVDAEGTQIPVHGLWGSAEKLYLRV
jgi:hypothetical protein